MDVLDALGHWPGAVWLQRNYVAYLVVNAAHIFAFALIVGAIVPLDLRLMRGTPVAPVAPLLTRTAAAGVGLAVATGFWLFSVKPIEYLDNPAFLWKLALFACALGNILLQHAGPGYRVALAGGAIGARVRMHAAASLLLWLAVLLAGRWIGFL
jgi:hypothetical protein